MPLKLRLNEDEIDRFAVNRWRFPGVDVVPYLSRHYPQGALFAHVIGHVGRINVEELKHLDPDRYDGTTHIGKTGIERYYEKPAARRAGVRGGRGQRRPARTA